MTIDSLQEDGTYWCIWFDKNQVQRGDAYGPHLITKVEVNEVSGAFA